MGSLINTTSYQDITRVKSNEANKPVNKQEQQFAFNWKIFAPLIGVVAAVIGTLWYFFYYPTRNPSNDGRGGGDGDGGDGDDHGGGRRRPAEHQERDHDRDVRDAKFKIIKAELQRRIDINKKTDDSKDDHDEDGSAAGMDSKAESISIEISREKNNAESNERWCERELDFEAVAGAAKIKEIIIEAEHAWAVPITLENASYAGLLMVSTYRANPLAEIIAEIDLSRADSNDVIISSATMVGADSSITTLADLEYGNHLLLSAVS